METAPKHNAYRALNLRRRKHQYHGWSRVLRPVHKKMYFRVPYQGYQDNQNMSQPSSGQQPTHKHAQDRLQDGRPCQNCSGPKSRGSCARIPNKHGSLFRLVIKSLGLLSEDAGVDARVGVDPTRTRGADHWSAKLRGMQEASVSNTACVGEKRNLKRSYTRACNRALKQGGAFYRGHWHPKDLFEARRRPTTRFTRTHKDPKGQIYLRTMTWNTGGLGTNVFQELETYDRDSNLDVVCIQETKRRFQSTWTRKLDTITYMWEEQDVSRKWEASS